MLKLRALTIFVIISGFASIIFVFLSEFFNLQRLSQRDVFILGEKNSVSFWKKRIIPLFYEQISTVALLIVLIFYLKQIWRKIKNEYILALIFFGLYEFISKVLSALIKLYFVDIPFNMTNDSLSHFFFVLFLNVVFDGLEYAIVVIPTIRKSIQMQPQQLQRRGTTFVVEDAFAPDIDNIANDDNVMAVDDTNFDDLPEVAAEGQPGEEVEENAFQNTGKLWLYLLMYILIAYFAHSIFASILYSIENNDTEIAIPENYKDNPLISGLFEGLTTKYSSHVLIDKNRVSNYTHFDNVGNFLQKVVISEKLINVSRREELVAAGSYMKYMLSIHSNALSFFFGLLRPLLFCFVFKVIEKVGLAEFHLKPAKPAICILLVAYAFYNTVLVFSEPLLEVALRSFQNHADCYVAKQNLPLDKFIINYERSNYNTVNHHPIFSLLFLKRGSPSDRQIYIKQCMKSVAPKLK